MSRLTLFAVSLVLVAACNEKGISDSALVESDDVGVTALRVDVTPAGEFGVPQTFLLDIVPNDALSLTLRPAVHLSGTLTAQQAAPLFTGDIPTVEAPLVASVSLIADNTVQSVYTLSDANGSYAITAVPGDYRLVVVPQDPTIPLFERDISVTHDATVDLLIPLGSSLWGQVSDEDGAPVVGARIYTRSATGREGATVTTDTSGRYVLSAPWGEAVELHCAGRDNGRDPSLPPVTVTAGETGSEIDWTYGPFGDITVSGRVVDSHGEGISHVTLRLDAAALDGYPEGTVASMEAITGPSGTFDLRPVAGDWWVKAIPLEDAQFSPVTLGRLSLRDDTQIPTFSLSPLAQISGEVLDLHGVPVPGAFIQAQETDFWRRTWSTYSDEAGQYALQVSDTPLVLTLLPPGERLDELPLTHIPVAAPSEALDLRFRTAAWAKGVLTDAAGAGIPWAILELRDLDGAQIGMAMSDDRGAFQVGWAPDAR